MELETPGYTRPLGGLGSSVCIPRHRSVSPTNRQLESSSSSSALRDGPPLRLQPRPLGVIKDDNFISCMSAGAARGAPPLVAYIYIFILKTYFLGTTKNCRYQRIHEIQGPRQVGPTQPDQPRGDSRPDRLPQRTAIQPGNLRGPSVPLPKSESLAPGPAGLARACCSNSGCKALH